MEDILKLMDEFEKRNNLSVSLVLNSDSSSHLEDFWDNEIIKSFDNLQELKTFLKDGKLKMSDDGRCISPIQII